MRPGKSCNVAGAGFDKQSEASEAMRNKMAELGQPIAEAASTETFGAYLSAWLDRVECEPKTRERYLGHADYVLHSKLADIPTVELRARHIEPFLLDLLRAPAIKREHLSVKTIHHIASVVSKK
jgi:hypothetical protein